MKHYVVGFFFGPNHEDVLLIRKNRPEWQAGLLNGVGGHIEDKEIPVEAMTREFKEEAGLDIPEHRWTRVAILERKNVFELSVFWAWGSQEEMKSAKSMTDEKVEMVQTGDLRTRGVVSNLSWLIPLCLEEGLSLPVRIRYTDESGPPG